MGRSGRGKEALSSPEKCDHLEPPIWTFFNHIVTDLRHPRGKTQLNTKLINQKSPPNGLLLCFSQSPTKTLVWLLLGAIALTQSMAFIVCHAATGVCHCGAFLLTGVFQKVPRAMDHK